MGDKNALCDENGTPFSAQPIRIYKKRLRDHDTPPVPLVLMGPKRRFRPFLLRS